MSLEQIEKLAFEYSLTRDALEETLQEIKEEMEKTQRRHRATLLARVNKVAHARAVLRASVDAQPELFEKPRTRVFHGVKVGWRKMKGKLVWDSSEKLVARIRKLYQDDIGALVETIYKPRKSGLEVLPAADLKKLGVEIQGGDDEVVVSTSGGDVEKAAAALLEAAADENLETALDLGQ